MKVREVVRRPKKLIEQGAWKVVTGSGGKMTRSSFPISRGGPVIFGRHWHWRIDKIACDVSHYRLLTAYDPRTEEYLSWLAVLDGDTTVLVARYEFHGTHPGWHCHAPCEEISLTETIGALDYRGADRFPGGNNMHRRRAFGITSEQHALFASFTFFNVETKPEGAMI